MNKTLASTYAKLEVNHEKRYFPRVKRRGTWEVVHTANKGEGYQRATEAIEAAHVLQVEIDKNERAESDAIKAEIARQFASAGVVSSTDD